MYFRRHLSALVLFAAVATLAGCSAGGDDLDSARIADSIARDLSLSQPPARDPALSDVPVVETPPPRPAAPRKTAPPPQKTAPPPAKTVEPPVVPIPTTAPSTGSIATGTTMHAAVASRVCTSAKPGDKIVATLTEQINGTNGVSIPAGANAVLEVVTATAITDSVKGKITFRVRTLEWGGKTYAVAATAEPLTDLERTRTTSTKSDVKKVAGGAVAGAIIGQIIGKDTKGTVIGAAAGAAAGTAVAVATGKYEGCVAQKGAVRITLSDAIILPIG